MITLSIDVTKLNKAKFVKGEKGTYCNLVLIETPNSDYGDYMVKQDSTKEERESGEKTPILGNAKIRKPKQQAASKPAPAPAQPDDDSDSIPF